MRLSLRFILPLAVVLILIAYAVVPLVDKLTERWFIRDLDMRSALIASSVRDSLLEKLQAGSRRQNRRVLQQDNPGRAIIRNRFLRCDPKEADCHQRSFRKNSGARCLQSVASKPAQLLEELSQGCCMLRSKPIESEGTVFGKLVFVHDMSFIQRRSAETRKYLFYFL